MTVRGLSIILAVLFLAMIIELVRRERLTFKYAFGWIFVTVIGIILAVFDQVLFGFAQGFGFHLASNFVFFTVCCGLIFLSLLLTIFLCQQNNRNDRLVQKIGLLEQEIKALTNKITKNSQNS